MSRREKPFHHMAMFQFFTTVLAACMRINTRRKKARVRPIPGLGGDFETGYSVSAVPEFFVVFRGCAIVNSPRFADFFDFWYMAIVVYLLRPHGKLSGW